MAFCIVLLNVVANKLRYFRSLLNYSDSFIFNIFIAQCLGVYFFMGHSVGHQNVPIL